MLNENEKVLGHGKTMNSAHPMEPHRISLLVRNTQVMTLSLRSRSKYFLFPSILCSKNGTRAFSASVPNSIWFKRRVKMNG